MNGAVILATAIDFITLITIYIAYKYRSVIVVMVSVAAIYRTFFGSILMDETIYGQVFIALVVNRIVAAVKHYPFVDDKTGITGFIYRWFPFALAEWQWHVRVSNLLNFIVRWLDRISLVVVILSMAYALWAFNMDKMKLVAIYPFVWGFFLVYVVVPILALEGIGRFFFTLSRERNFSLFCQWVGQGFRKSVDLSESGRLARSRNWVAEGFETKAPD